MSIGITITIIEFNYIWEIISIFISMLWNLCPAHLGDEERIVFKFWVCLWQWCNIRHIARALYNRIQNIDFHGFLDSIVKQFSGPDAVEMIVVIYFVKIDDGRES